MLPSGSKKLSLGHKEWAVKGISRPNTLKKLKKQLKSKISHRGIRGGRWRWGSEKLQKSITYFLNDPKFFVLTDRAS